MAENYRSTVSRFRRSAVSVPSAYLPIFQWLPGGDFNFVALPLHPSPLSERDVSIRPSGDGRRITVAKEDRGFASMDRAKQREIASKGGKAAHQKGTAHEWTSEEARDAGRKGGIASHRRRREQSAGGGSESNAGGAAGAENEAGE
jgi:uncharacterized protein